MQTWALHMFNGDIIYRSGERYWCKFSRLWRNNEIHMYFGGYSRPPIIRETFRAGYFHSCDWLSGLSKTTAIKKHLHSNTSKAFIALITIFRGRNLSKNISCDSISKGVFTAWIHPLHMITISPWFWDWHREIDCLFQSWGPQTVLVT